MVSLRTNYLKETEITVDMNMNGRVPVGGTGNRISSIRLVPGYIK